MKQRHMLFVLTLFLSIVFVLTGIGWGLELGDKAPDFTLPSTTGEKITLSDFRGKKLVLVEFYGADFSPV